jgi:5-methylthioadenosine/S-adenosylhomocysteine deaminase
MFEELRFALLGARAVRRDPGALSAADALELATLGGARALGLEADIGSLRPGKWADLVVLSLEDSPFAPLEDPVIAAILGGSPARVVATLIAGDERYAKGTTEWRDSRRAGRRARARMLR